MFLRPDAIEEGKRSSATIKDAISRSLDGCVALLGLIGNGAQHSTWLHEEVRQAKTKGIPCAFVRHTKATGSVPESYRNVPVFDWNSPELVQWVANLKG